MKKPVICAIILGIINIIFIGLLLLYSYMTSPQVIFNKVSHSIVEIKASSDNLESYGSGVVIKEDGYIITNSHVVTYKHNLEELIYAKIEIRTALQEDYILADIVSFDSFLDLAILKITNRDTLNQFMPIKIVSSENLKIGEKCYSIGNASNLSISMSAGLISNPAINLQIDGEVRKFIQSDISIASGSSGGALLNSNGDLIGITTLRIRDNIGNVIYGYGYSIPSKQVFDYLVKVHLF